MKVVKECKISLELERDEYFIIKNLLEMVVNYHNVSKNFEDVAHEYFDESDIDEIEQLYGEITDET